MKFTQHIPNFVSGFEPFEVEATSVEDLLSNEWIQSWSKDKGFSKYSVSIKEYTYPKSHKSRSLMAEFDDGHSWYVLGTLYEDVDLPLWEAKYKDVQKLDKP